MRHLILLSAEVLTGEEQRLLNFADWMGVCTKTIEIDNRSTLSQYLFSPPDSRPCLAMSASVLARLYEHSPEPKSPNFIYEYSTDLLIFGGSDSPQHRNSLSWLTAGAVYGVASPSADGAVFDLPNSSRIFSRQLAGLSFSVEHKVCVPTFELRCQDGRDPLPIMRINGRPMFVHLERAPCRLFLLAGSDIPDVAEPLYRSNSIEGRYHQIIPLLIFLRHSFGKYCWHSPECTARLIVDDPLLNEKYGFLEYRTLLSSMQRNRFGTSIAFIPWNYRRTSKRTALGLLGQGANLSICVHGCDHTNDEFKSSDQELLGWKAGLALERMRRHRVRTGVRFEKVMVFPGGLFSTDAVSALRANNYLAAANSTCFPAGIELGALKLGDFLRPAVTRFHGFPIFQRHYPQRLIDFAFNMLLGRPSLLVAHHWDFRDGYLRLEEFLQQLRGVEPELSWPPLSAQLTQSCMMRYAETDLIDVCFYTRRFQLHSSHPNTARFRLSKPEPDSSLIRAVRIDGIDASFSVADGFLRLEVQMDPGQVKDIEVLDHPRHSVRPTSLGASYSLGVLLHRGLSEFRDNTLMKHPTALNVAKALARTLKLWEPRKVYSAFAKPDQ
jgi:hypothetical protein